MKRVQKAQTNTKKIKIWYVVISLLVAVVLFIVLLNVESSYMKQYEETSVLVVKKEIPINTEITETNFSDFFEAKNRIINTIPATACYTKEDVLGKYVVTNVDAGNFITASMLNEFSKDVSELKDGVYLSISVNNLSQNVAGTLRAGDKINIYSVTEITQGIREVIPVVENIQVERSYDDTGVAITREDTETIASVFTIAVESKNVQEIIEKSADAGTLVVVKHVE